MANLITAEYFNEQMSTLGLKSTFSPSAYTLSTLITEASDWVENYCDRKFETQAITEQKYGPVRTDKRFVADNYPVLSVTSAYYDDSYGNQVALDVSNLRVRLGGIIEWKNPSGYWYPGIFYTLNYTTGFATIPTNVRRATALKIAVLVQPQYQGPQEREIFMMTNLEALIVDLLEPYRRERMG